MLQLLSAETNQRITEFLLKIESGASASRAREVLREVLRQTLGAKEFQTVTLSCDVDPQ